MAHKICPKCQTPAPIEATFCGQCGRQYRTQFAAAEQQSYLTEHRTPELQTPGPELLTPNFQRLSPYVAAAIVVLSAVVAILILMLSHRGKPGENTTNLTMGHPLVAPLPLAHSSSMSAADMVKQGEDPIEEEARRTLERDNAQLQTEPPASSVGSDGRIHLRGGGSITREQWDDANRRLRKSPAFRDPMPPPPVN